MNKEFKDPISDLGNKLNVIIALLLRLLPKDKESMSLKDQIKILDMLSVRPIDISKLLGRSAGYVGKELVNIRRENK